MSRTISIQNTHNTDRMKRFIGRCVPVTRAMMVAVAATWIPHNPAYPANDIVNATPPGSVVRWPGEGLEECGMGSAAWLPMSNSCWYPIDLLVQQSTIQLHRTRHGERESLTITIGPYPYPEQRLTVAPEMANPPAEQLDRIRRENTRVSALWWSGAPPVFTLPLAPPIDPLPEFRSFGSRRVLNGEPKNPHSGVDLSAPKGTPVRAAAAGTVVLTGTHYFSGNSVFVDHGDDLVTMYFHLDRIDVGQGDPVDRGQTLGTVGSTGRATGPHLHFGIRWHGARIDPAILLMDPESIPKTGKDPL